MTYKLTYFDCRGRAELIRLIFHAAGVNFVDERVRETPSDKSVQLPYLTVLGHEIQKSKTIARYIARKLNLAGTTDLEQCETDAVVDTCAELFDVIIDRLARNQPIGDQLDEELRAPLDRIEKAVALFGRDGFSVGVNLKWSDLAIYDVTSDLLEFIPNAFTEHKSSYSNILRVRASVEANQRVSGYLKYRPSSPFIVPQAL